MTSMLDPDLKPSPAREIVHKGKGCLAVLVAAAVLVFGGYLVYDRVGGLLDGWGEVADYPGPGKGTITVTVPEGATVSQIGDVLVENKVVQSEEAWNEAVASEERSTSIQPGRYVMQTEMRAIDALTLLINPGESRVRAQFTVQEGLRLSAQVNALVKGTKIKKSAYEKALDKPKTLGLPAYAKNRPEGFLFPDTYELTAQASVLVGVVLRGARPVLRRGGVRLQLLGIDHRGVQPQRLALVQAVVEHPGHLGPIAFGPDLLLDDAGHDHQLVR